MKQSEIAKLIFQQLDGRKCYVRSEGLMVDGSVENTCMLEYAEHYGIRVLIPVQWNKNKLHEKAKQLIRDNLEKFQMPLDLYKNILKTLEALKEEWVQAAVINPYSVVNIETVGSKGSKESKIYKVIITFENGSKTEIILLDK